MMMEEGYLNNGAQPSRTQAARERLSYHFHVSGGGAGGSGFVVNAACDGLLSFVFAYSIRQ